MWVLSQQKTSYFLNFPPDISKCYRGRGPNLLQSCFCLHRTVPPLLLVVSVRLRLALPSPCETIPIAQLEAGFASSRFIPLASTPRILFTHCCWSLTCYYNFPNEQAATYCSGQLLPFLNIPSHLVDEEPFTSILHSMSLDLKEVNKGSGTLTEQGFSKVFSRSYCYSRKDTAVWLKQNIRI